ncbi:MAG: EAL domain-containing protein, partial [Chloroflexota bacterium]|nr:EAL domain-containing protein [Chloroflexota bacterium]
MRSLRAQVFLPLGLAMAAFGLAGMGGALGSPGSTVLGIVGGAVLLVLALGNAVRTVRTMSRLTYEMTVQADEIARGRYTGEIHACGIGELDTAAAALNRVGDQVHAQLTELSMQAFHDPLTGLPNRAYVLDRLRQTAATVRRGDTTVAVLFVDVDDFKVINNSMGHRVGDQLLGSIAREVNACAGASDVVGRLGADEFAIVVHDVAAETRAIGLAHQLGERFQASVRVGSQQLFVGLSIGIASSSDGRERPEELLRNADMAMYAAKRAGKSRFVLFDPEMNARAVHRQQLESDLREALDGGEFRVYYQPLVSLESGVFSEVEALVRWIHPTRGMISPADFIPIAEESGLIVPLGRWVLREACRQVRAWELERPFSRPLVVGVNLSARQIVDSDLVGDVRAALLESGLPPERLKCEITESLALDESLTTSRGLAGLADLGVRFAIDDFGTGVSGLSYLRRFPVSTLKLDQSFVGGMLDHADDAAFVRGVIALARALS